MKQPCDREKVYIFLNIGTEEQQNYCLLIASSKITSFLTTISSASLAFLQLNQQELFAVHHILKQIFHLLYTFHMEEVIRGFNHIKLIYIYIFFFCKVFVNIFFIVALYPCIQFLMLLIFYFNLDIRGKESISELRIKITQIQTVT